MLTPTPTKDLIILIPKTEQHLQTQLRGDDFVCYITRAENQLFHLVMTIIQFLKFFIPVSSGKQTKKVCLVISL